MQKYSTAGRDDALPSTKAKKFVRDVSAQGKTKTTATSNRQKTAYVQHDRAGIGRWDVGAVTKCS